MFRVVLKNVGKDMVNREFIAGSSDINEVVMGAFEVCGGILGYDSSLHFEGAGDEMNIMLHKTCVGSLTITKLH